MSRPKSQSFSTPQLQLAISHHQAGRLQQAESLYKKMHDNLDAANLIGVIYYQTGRYQQAVETFQRVLRTQPGNAMFHYNLGLAWRALEQLPDAAASYRRAVTLQPNYIDAWLNLGAVLQDQTQFTAAIDCYREVLQRNPAHAQALNNLGVVYRSQGQPDQARAAFQQAIDVDPNYAAAHANLAAIWKDCGDWDQSIACSQRALALDPNCIDAHNNLGNAYEEQGELEQAVSCYQRALACGSVRAESHFNMGSALRLQGNNDAAIASLRAALAINPDFAEASNSLGIALQADGKLDEAIACYQHALNLKPDYANACNNIGIALMNQGQLDAALAHYRRALEIKPDLGNAHSNLLFCHNYHPDFSAEQIFAAYQNWNSQQAAHLSQDVAAFSNTRDPERRLRIGYLSADFNNHSVIRFAAPLIQGHDRNQFEVYCYYNRFHYDAHTVQIMAAVDKFTPCLALSDEQLAAQIRADGIDILIDLAGHTEGNRLLTFARKPAPLQASWLGFGYTTGLSAIDYLIGDPVFMPSEAAHLFSEKLLQLPHCFATYQPAPDAPLPNDSPAQRNGYVTFGCLSRSERINHKMLAAWAQLLKQLPSARLRLDSRNFNDPALAAATRERFIQLGVDAAQLQIGFTSPVWSVYQEIDIALDCFPHNSGTTTYEALWMGVPVITLADRPSVGRLGASILHCISHAEWIAHDAAEYVARAVALAGNLTNLAWIRAHLRQQMQASRLLDQPAFVRAMEAAYRHIWRNWCAGAPALATTISASAAAIDSTRTFNDALAHHQAGRLQQAATLYQDLPAHPDAMHLLGVIDSQHGNHQAAIEKIRAAIQCNPDNAAYHCNLGSAYQGLKQLEPAVASFERALQLNPNYPLALNNLGNALKDLGRFDAALASFQRALGLSPDYVDAHSNLGSTLRDLGRLDEAIVCYRQALAIKPNFSEAYFNLGNAYRAQMQSTLAIQSFQTALALQPDFYRAHNNLGLACKDQGQLDQAIVCFEQALAIEPTYIDAKSNLLFCHNYHPTLTAAQIFQRYQDWNTRIAAPLFDATPFNNLRDPNKRLKVGYVSADFQNHSVMHFAAPLISQHDHNQLDVFCYASQRGGDASTALLQARVEHWLPCADLDDAQLAQRIRADGIDILVDLSGHTLGHRLLTFARKAAPVQVSWLGFGSTTGLSAIDYFIGDPVFTPPESATFFSEQLLPLPDCFAAYQPVTAAPIPSPSPAQRNGYVTFGCLSRNERLNPQVIAAWAAILQALPSARLRLDSKNFSDPNLAAALLAQFAAHGIDAAQLQIGFTSPVWSVYQEVDIVLDCFPHNSGTTTYEALWMGVPVVTLADRPSVGRIGASILSALGHPEWIAHDGADYVARAVALAGNLTTLAWIRGHLRQQMQASPLLDSTHFARNVESAYRTIWQRWCAQEPT